MDLSMSWLIYSPSNQICRVAYQNQHHRARQVFLYCSLHTPATRERQFRSHLRFTMIDQNPLKPKFLYGFAQLPRRSNCSGCNIYYPQSPQSCTRRNRVHSYFHSTPQNLPKGEYSGILMATELSYLKAMISVVVT